MWIFSSFFNLSAILIERALLFYEAAEIGVVRAEAEKWHNIPKEMCHWSEKITGEIAEFAQAVANFKAAQEAEEVPAVALEGPGEKATASVETGK